MILGFCGRKDFSKVEALRNVQQEYHTQDPVNFPRTSRQAYFMDPAELLTLQKKLRAKEEEMRVIYHSHIDAPAYFSEEDRRMALSEGLPVYPGVDYLVVSVAQRYVREACLYRWSAEKKDFVMIQTIPGLKNAGD